MTCSQPKQAYGQVYCILPEPMAGRRASERFRTGFVILPPASCSRHNATHSFDAKCHPHYTVLNFMTATFVVRAPPTLFSLSRNRRLQPSPTILDFRIHLVFLSLWVHLAQHNVTLDSTRPLILPTSLFLFRAAYSRSPSIRPGFTFRDRTRASVPIIMGVC